MENYKKYSSPKPIPIENRQWPDRQITTPPVWYSVDLRDGNQALPVPMNPKKKLDYFKMLINIGFKEIEVGFPSASQDDFDFVRELIEGGHIPADVRISVLTQARKHLIDRTVESLKGTHAGIVHCYVATSDLHGQMVFGRDRDEVLTMAIKGTQMVKDAVKAAGMEKELAYEFSPEEFTDSDLDFVVDLCKSVKETWGPSKKSDFIINLPATVERRPPYQYADMVEYFCQKYPYVDETTVSIHAHNDQGCAVAASEMAVMAGADRVEGTIFGHGERTGNVDLAVLALNLYSRGIDIGLDFSNMPKIIRTVEEASGIPVHERHPYAGQLVFTAFSGSHQDAIRKGIESKDKAAKLFKQGWKVPYLHIDPADIGRSYEKLIRINSQSGKGGIAYVLEHDFGIYAPRNMHPEIGRTVQKVADEKGDEIDAKELEVIFRDSFVDVMSPVCLTDFSRVYTEDTKANSVTVKIAGTVDGQDFEVTGKGNGPISAAVHALQDHGPVPGFALDDFCEQSLGHDADATAMAFVGIRRASDDKLFYGAGEHSNIDQAAIHALFSALNRSLTG